MTSAPSSRSRLRESPCARGPPSPARYGHVLSCLSSVLCVLQRPGDPLYSTTGLRAHARYIKYDSSLSRLYNNTFPPTTATLSLVTSIHRLSSLGNHPSPSVSCHVSMTAPDIQLPFCRLQLWRGPDWSPPTNSRAVTRPFR